PLAMHCVDDLGDDTVMVWAERRGEPWILTDELEHTGCARAVHAGEIGDGSRRHVRRERRVRIGLARARERDVVGAGTATTLELGHHGVGRLAGDVAISGDLAADDREQTGHALTFLVVEQPMFARHLALLDALLAHERADARPGEVDVVEPRVRERAARGVMEVAHVVFRRSCVRWYAVGLC